MHSFDIPFIVLAEFLRNSPGTPLEFRKNSARTSHKMPNEYRVNTEAIRKNISFIWESMGYLIFTACEHTVKSSQIICIDKQVLHRKKAVQPIDLTC